MLVLLPLAAYFLSFLGWSSLYLPEDLPRFLELALLAAAVGCAYPLRRVLKRAQPLGWGGKFVVFSLVLALWFSSLAPLLMIANAKLDASAPRKLERVVLDTEERGTNTCKVKVNDWDDIGGTEFHWLWLECEHPNNFTAGKTLVTYDYHPGAFGFPYVTELRVKQ